MINDHDPVVFNFLSVYQSWLLTQQGSPLGSIVFPTQQLVLPTGFPNLVPLPPTCTSPSTYSIGSQIERQVTEDDSIAVSFSFFHTARMYALAHTHPILFFSVCVSCGPGEQILIRWCDPLN